MGKINKNMLFSNFVSDDASKAAVMMAEQCCQDPGYAGNPYFVFGNREDCTHILNAIANEIESKHSHLKIHYIDCSNFEKELEGLSKCDVLIVDKIDLIETNEKHQELIFKDFNRLFLDDGQVVVSSNKSYEVLNAFSGRMIHRFQNGITCEILK